MVTFEELKNKTERVAVVGLGYVGLPLAVALAKYFTVVGFDVSERRISELKGGVDRTREVPADILKSAAILYTADPSELKTSKFIIVAVPTPIDDKNNPDLSLVEKATATVGKNLAAGSVVVYESTVYPGVTEDICLPILTKESGLAPHTDFKVGYSPERINPGDREHTIEKIVKVVAAEDAESLVVVSGVYGAITTIFPAASIKVAEAAKVIENTQRDLNIALMNELALICNKMDFSIYDVLKAAGTKWNFLKFYPGLVGGHCIGVDPYYLTHRAEELGHKPEVILSGRKINDAMGGWIAGETIKKLQALGKDPKQSVLLVCGITFKEDVPDVRNSKVADVIKKLEDHGVTTVVIDPMADPDDVKREYNVDLVDLAAVKNVDGIVLAVAHGEFITRPLTEWRKFCSPNAALLVDIKGLFSPSAAEAAGFNYWSL